MNWLGLIGRGGQKFLDRCVPKVAELRARFPEKDIEVDGGVGPKTIGVCADAGQPLPLCLLCRSLTTFNFYFTFLPATPTGSNVIVAGTAIFNDPQPDKVIALLKETVDTAQAKIAKSRA